MTTPDPMEDVEVEEEEPKQRAPSRSPLKRKGYGTKQRRKFKKKYGDRVKFEDPVARDVEESKEKGSGQKGKQKGKPKGKGKGKQKGKQKGKGKKGKPHRSGRDQKDGGPGGRA